MKTRYNPRSRWTSSLSSNSVHPLVLAAAIAASALSGCNAMLGGSLSESGGPTNGDGTGDGDGDSLTPPQVNPDGTEVVHLVDGLEIKGQPKYYRVVRLTHEQWENAVQDVLGLSALPGESSGFIPDPPNGKFSNNERALYVTDSLVLDYQRAAEAVAEDVAANAALLATLGADPGAVIQTVGRRAFRRALTPDEQSRYQALWDRGAEFYESGSGFESGARVFLEALLQSPNFLYQVQLSEDGTRLAGNELATKLSFLLRNTNPSESLLDSAESGALDTDEGLSAVVSQMIEEQDATAAADRFHNELFGMHRYMSINKSATAFPSYNEALNEVLMQADIMFFSHLFQTDGGVRSILTSNVGFINDATAGFYGLTASGPELTQVALDAGRPGFLTRVGFLAYNASLIDPDPIHRGVDINNKLLCAQMEPPPGEIPALPTPIDGQTNRQRVIAHTEVGVCAGCHGTIINPPGFSLEGFDAMGQVRATDNGHVVDTSGTYGLLSGEQYFEGIVELTNLLADSERVHACYAAHVTEYVLARDVGVAEADLLQELGESSVTTDLSIKELLLAAVTSPRFTTATSGNP